MGNSALKSVLEEVKIEREYQDYKWGPEFDDKNTLNDWVAYIVAYTGHAVQAKTPMEARTQLLKVASLAAAALQSFDRNKGFPPRHYVGDN